jgi:hypothetical protein
MTRKTADPIGGVIRDMSVATCIVLGIVALGVACVIVAGVALLSSLGDVRIGRRPLKPIPVAATSCPYLRLVHGAAGPAGDTYLRLLSAQDDPGEWEGEKSRHAQQLLVLELALRDASTHVPSRIASELDQVVTNVAAGRKELAAATSASEYVSRSASQVFSGNEALANASDLVGSACGFELSPSVSGLGGGPG